MNRLLKILGLVSIPFLIWLGFRLEAMYIHAVVGEPAQVINEIGKPYAVLTIDYGEPPEGFIEGEFYVLKCLKIRATKIDYGFCPIKRSDYYDTRKKKE
jgi:hypothetical protein